MDRYIQRLLFVYGHQTYHRIALTMNLFYHKCVVIVTIQILSQFFGGFSATSTFDSILFGMYNLTMTTPLSLGFGMFEKHLPDEVLMNNSYLYKKVNYF